MHEIDEAYLNLLDGIIARPEPFRKQEPLVAMYPMRGGKENVDIMFIGRSTNGWNWTFDVEELIRNKQHVFSRIKANGSKEAGHSMDYPPNEELRWVDDHDKDHPFYNANKSQFWQVVRAVMKRPGNKNKADWWRGLVWTNLHKLSRVKENPTAAMSKVMNRPALKLLHAEAACYAPDCIICLTGIGWASGFLASCATAKRVAFPDTSEHIHYAGKVNVAGIDTSLIIADHPQGKSSRMIGEEIINILATLNHD